MAVVQKILQYSVKNWPACSNKRGGGCIQSRQVVSRLEETSGEGGSGVLWRPQVCMRSMSHTTRQEHSNAFPSSGRAPAACNCTGGHPAVCSPLTLGQLDPAGWHVTSSSSL